MTDRARKVIVLLVVTGAHVAAIVSIRLSSEVQTDTAETIYRMYVDTEPARNPRQKAKTRRSPIRPGPESIVTAGAAAFKSSADPVPVVPTINWHEEGNRSANSVVSRTLQEEAQSPLLSKPKTLTPEPEIVEKGIFTLTPPHKSGTFENLGEGVTREWTSEYCYWWSDIGPQGRVPHEKCLPKFANPTSGNLFKQLRPKYLDLPTHARVQQDEGSDHSGAAEP